MYRYMERELAQLDDAERFITDNTRRWVAAVMKRECPARAIEQGFLAAGMIGGMGAFHRILMLLNQHARMPMGYANQHCPRLAEGESLVLTLVSDRDIVRPALDVLITRPCAASLIEQSVDELCAALQIAGLTIGQDAGR